MTNLEQRKCKNMADDIADAIDLSPQVYEAFCNCEREIFVPVASSAYELNAHPISGQQWISSPLTVAKMTMALECENIDNVLEIGCGSGYQAYILSKLAYRVFSVERIGKLVIETKKRFEILKTKNIHIRHDDGNYGWRSYAPYDRILFSCACEKIDQRILDQLKVGGILVAPIRQDQKQFITKITKTSETEIKQETLDECLFVPLLDKTQ